MTKTKALVPAQDVEARMVFYATAKAAIEKARSVDEVKSIRDKAEAVRAYAHQAKDKSLETAAAEIRLRAERQGGALIGQMKIDGTLREGRREKLPGGRVVLADLGVSTQRASEWQELAAVPEQDFESFVEKQKAANKPVYAEQVRRMVTKPVKRAKKAAAIKDKAKPLAEIGKGYVVIYADPPWQLAGMTARRAIENQYPTMSTPDICKLPVKDIVADDAVLLLWTTVPTLPEALQVMEAWGFTYRSCAVWVKPSIGMGQWFRLRHELLLLGARGKMPVPLEANRPDSVIEAKPGRHSEKPEQVYELIERAYPEFVQPDLALELFRRGAARTGWSVWGNEAT